MMKGLFSIGSALVTLFLVTANAWQPTFQFFDNSVGTRFCRGCMQCLVQSNSPQYSFSAIIGNDYCSNLNGKMSVATSYRNLTGTLTVDFSPDVPGNTGMYMSFPNGTWIGGIAPSKVSGNSAIVNMNGTGQWGSTNYVGGWCVAEVTQSQKVQPSDAVTNPDAQYSYNISLYDNSRNWIGGTTDGPLFVQGGKTGGIDSMLPKVFEITSGYQDSDPFTMSYYQPYLPSPSNEVWDAYSTAHQCDMARLLTKNPGNEWGYGDMHRTDNCGFPC